MIKILIMGLSTSGKTTLARSLFNLLKDNKLSVEWFNADVTRKRYDDWDFSEEGRVRQCERMILMCDNSTAQYIICDFIAPLKIIRDKFQPGYLIWVDTITESRYKDTDAIFEPPSSFNLRVITKDSEYWAREIYKELYKHDKISNS